mmetsp:Transcript_5608/g.7844  ORF Transcript_5608/g.7844 Transcript_5608/m.7844 type:complete len:698 (+) Transcript_5608:187-2280(+)|eukprot:CAMPEP_0168547142 /NCGR_PEP_ID=MMETSP0413-20121227/3877_1 /TAXON_ID=136452 /ORGANISM="Filamoeba nolandi, Strain NC-AS-23-1" /LENGTH=697 /DNA_ID=CAMNT_0008577373 /DNA_START=168 /DNA_END=2261 /DNA_ORIENTATION=-
MSRSSTSSDGTPDIELATTGSRVSVTSSNDNTTKFDSTEKDIIDDVYALNSGLPNWEVELQKVIYQTKRKLKNLSLKQLLKDHYGVLILLIVFSIILIICKTVAKWDLEWQGWFVLVLIMFVVAVLVKDAIEPGIVFIFASTILLTLKIIEVPQALSGFSNEGVATVAVLFIVAKGIQMTGALDVTLKRLLASPKSIPEAQVRLMVPIAIVSAFLNNTPIVAMMIPVVEAWSTRIQISPSKLMIPLSFATILGGTCTLIGTSTNLVVIGLAQEKEPNFNVGLFELGQIGAPVAVFGLVYILVFSKWLLPERVAPQAQFKKNPREYSIAASVAPRSAIVGKTIEEAGLRGLSGLFLVEIQRGNDLISAPASDTKLEGGDVLVFAGMVTSVKDLWTISGIEPVTNQVEKINAPDRRLFEAVIANHSSLNGVTVRDSKFRSTYDAAIIAVHRYGERVRNKIGDIVLKAGDCLLIEADATFLKKFGEDENFALVSVVADYIPPVQDIKKTVLVLILAGLMILMSTLEYIELITAALLVSFIYVTWGCLSMRQAMKAMKFNVILTIAAAFGVGKALENTGVADAIAGTVMDIFQPIGDVGLLFGVYLSTMLLTALTSNSATVIIMYPITYNFYTSGLFSHKTVVFILMMAASADFSTPIGYQTNLMVSGPGGYHFTDYTKFGLPLQLVCCISTVLICYSIFE